MNKRIAFFVAGTALVAGTPSMALGAAPTDSDTGAAVDAGSGDAVVTLLEESTPPIYPGQDAWVVLPWTVQNAEAREFEVTSVSSDGIEIAYPENTGDHTSLFSDGTLSTFEIDYTALQVRVDPESPAPRVLDVTVSYVSDTGAHEEVIALPVEVDETPFDGEGLRVQSPPVTVMETTATQWIQFGLEGLENATNVEVRVAGEETFGIVYPSERDHSRPNLGRDVQGGTADVAAVRIDTSDTAPGNYSVRVEVSYFVGATKLSEFTTVDVEVVAGANDGVYYDSTQTLGDWVINPNGTDSAVAGQWDLSVPEAADWNGTATQLGYTPSGAPGVITTGALGTGTGANDVDGGLTSAVSPVISLPEGEAVEMSLSYYFAYLFNASSADYFRVSIVGESSSDQIIYHTARNKNKAAKWKTKSFDLSGYAGQDIQILVEAADESGGSLIEAAVADIMIVRVP